MFRLQFEQQWAIAQIVRYPPVDDTDFPKGIEKSSIGISEGYGKFTWLKHGFSERGKKLIEAEFPKVRWKNTLIILDFPNEIENRVSGISEGQMENTLIILDFPNEIENRVSGISEGQMENTLIILDFRTKSKIE